VPEVTGYNKAPLLVLIALAVAIVVAFFARPQLLAAPGVFPYLTALVAVSVSVGVLAIGPALGDYVALVYVTGAGAFLLLTPRQRTTQLVLIGACYAVVLAFQDGHPAPVARWVVVMGFVVVTGAIFGRFLARIEALALAERATRGDAERARAQLESASRHKTEFLANMSHELRTPLNVIIGFSEVLASQAFGPLNEKQAEYVDDVLASGRHLLGLINDILDLAKADAGRMELQLVELDLEATLASALLPFQEEAVRRGVDLRLEADAGLGCLRADESKLTQALGRLASNALKFTPDGGRVDLRAVRHTDHVRISVSDTGPGIAAADHERIFDAFAHGEDSSTIEQGAGLGLALARRYAELHGGSLTVRSEAGSGATFELRLPTERVAVEPAAPAEVL
jgi:signal transduction histidine kinase